MGCIFRLVNRCFGMYFLTKSDLPCQYFIVLLKDRPFELWDLKSLNIIREMPGNFPPVTTLEWSPTQNHPLKNAKVGYFF